MKRNLFFLALAVIALAAIAGCSNDTSNEIDGPVAKTGTCLGCHASEDALKAALPEGSKDLVAYIEKGG